MLLAEPPPSSGDIHFSLLGIPVRIHPMFWLVTLMFGLNQDNLSIVLIWIVAVFIGILWHEMGHALVIRWFGYLPWITLHGMGGLASYDPTRHRRNHGLTSTEDILISFAGPGAGFLLAALLVVILFAAKQGDHLLFLPPFYIPVVVGLDNFRLQVLLNFLFYICGFWGLLNLLPIYPLDGGQIARELFLRFNLRDGIRQSLMLSLVTALSIGIYGATKYHSGFFLIFFAYLAYENYQALQAYSGRGRW
jgi:Zn-dependent protease